LSSNPANHNKRQDVTYPSAADSFSSPRILKRNLTSPSVCRSHKHGLPEYRKSPHITAIGAHIKVSA